MFKFKEKKIKNHFILNVYIILFIFTVMTIILIIISFNIKNVYLKLYKIHYYIPKFKKFFVFIFNFSNKSIIVVSIFFKL